MRDGRRGVEESGGAGRDGAGMKQWVGRSDGSCQALEKGTQEFSCMLLTGGGRARKGAEVREGGREGKREVGR